MQITSSYMHTILSRLPQLLVQADTHTRIPSADEHWSAITNTIASLHLDSDWFHLWNFMTLNRIISRAYNRIYDGLGRARRTMVKYQSE